MDAGHIRDAVRELEKVLGLGDDPGPETYGRLVTLMTAAKQKHSEMCIAIQQAELTRRAWLAHLCNSTPVT